MSLERVPAGMRFRLVSLYGVIKVKIFVYFNVIISSKSAEKYTNLFRIEADSFFRFSIVQGRKDSAEFSIELFRSYTVEK